MTSIFKIVSLIKNNEEIIIANINGNDLKTYKSIQNGFCNSDITSNNLFQIKYNSFYRLNGAGLTKEFKQNYFKLLQEKRHIKNFSREEIKNILLELYKYKNAKGLNCIYFSFTTKLIHTIDNDFPIYDSKIKRVFGFKSPHPYHNINEKIETYLTQHENINFTYKQILEENLLDSIFILFGLKFPNSALSKVKILDFIFWTVGKLNLKL